MGCSYPKLTATKLQLNDSVQAKVGITYSGGGCYSVQSGMQGKIVSLEAGDAKIKWEHGPTHWLLGEDFWKLEVVQDRLDTIGASREGVASADLADNITLLKASACAKSVEAAYVETTAATTTRCSTPELDSMVVENVKVSAQTMPEAVPGELNTPSTSSSFEHNQFEVDAEVESNSFSPQTCTSEANLRGVKLPASISGPEITVLVVQPKLASGDLGCCRSFCAMEHPSEGSASLLASPSSGN